MYNNDLIENLEKVDIEDIRAFQFFNMAQGKAVLDILKGMYRFYEPSIAGTSRDSEVFFRDGLKTVINDIEFIANYLQNKELIKEINYGPDDAGTTTGNARNYDYTTE